MAEIKCTVDNCYYWDSGNICAADAIEVAKNFFGDDKMEAGHWQNLPSQIKLNVSLLNQQKLKIKDPSPDSGKASSRYFSNSNKVSTNK